MQQQRNLAGILLPLAFLPLALLTPTTTSCSGPVSSTPKQPAHAHTLDQLLLHEEAESVDLTRYRGTLFTARVGQTSDERSIWVRCPREVAYRYERLKPTSVQIDIRDKNATSQLLPGSEETVVQLVDANTPIKLTYQVAGRFVLDISPPTDAKHQCPAATHIVRSIVVGAYQVVVGEKGQADDLLVADTRVDTFGHPTLCAETRSPSPVEGCIVPLAFELVPIPGRDRNAKLRVNDVAGPSRTPSTSTMTSIATHPSALYHDD